jgi:Uma2 family endonuclease
MATTTTQLTVEDFRKLPEDAGGVYHELRHGEIATVTRPKLKHSLIERGLRRLLEAVAEPGSLMNVEIAFRPLPEHELRVADVAYLSAARFQQADPEDNIRGAPDIVVEVLFRRRDLREGEALPGERCHPVLAPDGRTVTYRPAGSAGSVHHPSGRRCNIRLVPL